MNTELVAKLLYEAARGYMEPYMREGVCFSSDSYDQAKSTSGAISAVASVFSAIALAEREAVKIEADRKRNQEK